MHICPEQLYLIASMVNFVQVMLKLYPLASQPLDVYDKLYYLPKDYLLSELTLLIVNYA